MQPSHKEDIKRNADQLCQTITTFVERAKADGMVLSFKRGLNGQYETRIANLRCSVVKQFDGPNYVVVAFDRMFWHFGYRYSDTESTTFYPIQDSHVTTFTRSDLLLESDWYFQAIKPYRLFGHDIW